MVNDSWLELANFPYLGRDHPAMILADDKIFVGMGSIDGENLGDWRQHDILNTIIGEKTNFNFEIDIHPFYFSINNIP